MLPSKLLPAIPVIATVFGAPTGRFPPFKYLNEGTSLIQTPYTSASRRFAPNSMFQKAVSAKFPVFRTGKPKKTILKPNWLIVSALNFRLIFLNKLYAKANAAAERNAPLHKLTSRRTCSLTEDFAKQLSTLKCLNQFSENH